MIRVAGAILRRDARTQLSYPFQYVTQGVGMLFSLFSFFFIGRLVGDSPALAGLRGGYFPFAVVGMVVVMLAGTALTSFTGAIRSEQGSGTLEILLASPARLAAVVAGWMAWPLTVAGAQAAVFFAVAAVAAGGSFDVTALPAAFPAFVLTVLSFVALGLVSGAFVVVTKRGDPFTPLVVSATNLVAGALFPVAILPGWLQALARLFPAFYGFNAMRGLLLGGESFLSTLDELAILAAFDVALLAAGMWTVRRALRVAKVTGTLASG